MGLQVRTVRPDKPVPGEALMRGSVAGRKTRFVNDTNTGSISLTLGAGTRTSLGFTLSAWAPDLPLDARNAGNLVSWDSCVAWAFEELYVDADDPANYIGSPSLTADQLLVEVQKVEQIIPAIYSGSTRYTATTRYIIINGGASSHTVFVTGQYKLIMYGDEVL